MRAITSENGEHNEIRNQQTKIKGIGLVKPLKSFVQKMLPEVRYQAFGGKKNGS